MAKNFFDVNDRTLDPSEVHRKDKEELYETAFNKDQKIILDDIGGGGSALPDVTSADNGMVLTVVDGVWDKASIDDGSDEEY